MKGPKEKLDALLFYYLLAAQASSFLIHHSEHNKLGHTWYATPHFAALCDLWDTMLCHCTSAHILSLLATSLINNFGLVLYMSKSMFLLVVRTLAN